MPLLMQRAKPRVILGLMTIGPETGGGARITSLDEYKRILSTFQSRGYNEIDTARSYVNGKQESFTAQAKWKDRGLALATKVYPTPSGNHKPNVLREKFETSLKELGTDCVDIFYLHAADRSVPFEETLECVNQFHKEGKFVQLGLSNFAAFEVAEVVMTCKAHGWVTPSVYQGMYNAVTRGIEPELLPCLKRYGIPYVAYNPIAGGLFSGKYDFSDPSKIPDSGRYSDAVGRMGTMYRKRYFHSPTFDAFKSLTECRVLEKHNLSMVETALRWCVWHSDLDMGRLKEDGGVDKNAGYGDDGVIIGISSHEQLEQNLTDLEKGPLPEEVVKMLDQAWAIAKPSSPNYWHLDLKYTYDTRTALFGPQSKESSL
ncbi:aflatoxin B1 aldehyde reductase member 3 [Viridothelium virens]|uniref:Aflatoxin B1 aldehyde reductase member 3 n=1 Tax=Viridothelium virens TaxID=1048519 RepID=A0A6A6H157_VIRVR|nr:aflatoxin B1 aldehyde reductase member 3 [Viridothelium virens]